MIYLKKNVTAFFSIGKMILIIFKKKIRRMLNKMCYPQIVQFI